VPYDPRERFRSLPKPVRPEEMVEMVDVSELPVRDEEGEARERLLREAGGGSP
jgi:hypothetical protein